MKATIKKYMEREIIQEKGFLHNKVKDGDTLYVLHCRIEISKEERIALDQAGLRYEDYYYLTPMRHERDENYINFHQAASTEGARFVCKSPGVLRQNEAILRTNIKKAYDYIEPMLGYSVEEEYVYDPATETAVELDET